MYLKCNQREEIKLEKKSLKIFFAVSRVMNDLFACEKKVYVSKIHSSKWNEKFQMWYFCDT